MNIASIMNEIKSRASRLNNTRKIAFAVNDKIYYFMSFIIALLGVPIVFLSAKFPSNWPLAIGIILFICIHYFYPAFLGRKHLIEVESTYGKKVSVLLEEKFQETRWGELPAFTLKSVIEEANN